MDKGSPASDAVGLQTSGPQEPSTPASTRHGQSVPWVAPGSDTASRDLPIIVAGGNGMDWNTDESSSDGSNMDDSADDLSAAGRGGRVLVSTGADVQTSSSGSSSRGPSSTHRAPGDDSPAGGVDGAPASSRASEGPGPTMEERRAAAAFTIGVGHHALQVARAAAAQRAAELAAQAGRAGWSHPAQPLQPPPVSGPGAGHYPPAWAGQWGPSVQQPPWGGGAHQQAPWGPGAHQLQWAPQGQHWGQLAAPAPPAGAAWYRGEHGAGQPAAGSAGRVGERYGPRHAMTASPSEGSAPGTDRVPGIPAGQAPQAAGVSAAPASGQGSKARLAGGSQAGLDGIPEREPPEVVQGRFDRLRQFTPVSVPDSEVWTLAQRGFDVGQPPSDPSLPAMLAVYPSYGPAPQRTWPPPGFQGHMSAGWGATGAPSAGAAGITSVAGGGYTATSAPVPSGQPPAPGGGYPGQVGPSQAQGWARPHWGGTPSAGPLPPTSGSLFMAASAPTAKTPGLGAGGVRGVASAPGRQASGSSPNQGVAATWDAAATATAVTNASATAAAAVAPVPQVGQVAGGMPAGTPWTALHQHGYHGPPAGPGVGGAGAMAVGSGVGAPSWARSPVLASSPPERPSPPRTMRPVPSASLSSEWPAAAFMADPPATAPLGPGAAADGRAPGRGLASAGQRAAASRPRGLTHTDALGGDSGLQEEASASAADSQGRAEDQRHRLGTHDTLQ